MTEIYSYLNTIAAYSLLVSLLLLIKDRNKIRGAYSVMAFLVCLLLYLLIETVCHPILRGFMVIGPFLVPYTFWLMARSMFRDEPFSRRRLIGYTLITLLIYYMLYFVKSTPEFAKGTAIVGRVLSVVFIILAILEAQSGKSTDLDDDRIRLRKYFTYLIGFIVLVTLLSELGLQESEQELPRLVQRSAILLLNTVFIVTSFSLKSALFDVRKKPTAIQHPELIDRIQQTMSKQGLYRKEKLTIGQLAEAVGEQEYKVRKVINQELGYRNFIDFTNSYRIQEAVDLLSDASKSSLTILEIAYKTGFNSIGPFNRAFKQSTGQTPTDFRKNSGGKGAF